MYWNNTYDLVKISVNKLNDKEHKLIISNKSNDTYQTIINEYYWSSDFISLDDLKTLLIAGLRNETVDNLNCSTIIQQNENSITVCLSFRIESKFIKQKPSDIKFILDKVNFNEIEKHNFLINDVCNVIHPTIDNEQVIRCYVIAGHFDKRNIRCQPHSGHKLMKIINYADHKNILSIEINELKQIIEFNSFDNKYTLDIFRNFLIKKFPDKNMTMADENYFYFYADYDFLFEYLTELNYRIHNISKITVPKNDASLSHCNKYGYNLTLQKSTKKYNIEFIPYSKIKISNNDVKFTISNLIKIEGKYKILYEEQEGVYQDQDGKGAMIIERYEE